jgi:hypothetical protein
LVDPGFLSIDEFVDDLHEWCDLRGARLVVLLKDLAVPETFLGDIDDLVIPDVDVSVVVLEEPVGIVP